MAKNNIPRHVGFIPDGNRRWATDKGLPKEDGYKHGMAPVGAVTQFTLGTASQPVTGNGTWQPVTVTLGVTTAQNLYLYLYSNTNSSAPSGTSVYWDDVAVADSNSGMLFREGFENGLRTSIWSCAYLPGAGVQDLVARDVIYLGGLAIAEIDNAGVVHELHSDHLGTPRLITNGSSGAVEGAQTFGPYGESLGQAWGYMPLTGYTGHLQTEPNGLIYMRGRFYSPAWHCFLNSDQGADPKQWSQYAYAGGNPFINVDPSGMSFLGDLLDPLHLAHSARVNWNHGRQYFEIAAAVAACIVVDVASDGAAAGTNDGIMASIGGAVNSAGAAVGASASMTPVFANAVIGGVAGGAIGGSWRSAAQGMVLGASLGYVYSWWAAPGGDTLGGFASNAGKGLAGMFGPTDSSSGVLMKAIGAGVVNTAMTNGSAWNNFRNGFIEGGVLGGIGFDFPESNGALYYLGNQAVGEWAYRSFTKDGTHILDFKSPAENGLGWGAFGDVSLIGY